MKPVEKIWMNGEFVDWNDASIHVLSHIVHYGYGAFEGIRCYETVDGGRAIFRLEDHIRRLCESTRILRLDHPWSEDELTEVCAEVIRVNGLSSAYIRPVIAVGYGELGLASIHNPPVAAVGCFEWGAYLGEEGMRNGIRARVSSFCRSHVNARMLKAKVNGMYVNNILAKREAVDDGYDEAIMLEPSGYVAEASGENVFIIRDGVVRTPPVTMVLAGITRDSVIRILRDLGYEVREALIARDELYIADEVFMVGTAAEVTPVREIDRRTIGNGGAGEITRRVQEIYLATVRGDHPEYAEWLHRV